MKFILKGTDICFNLSSTFMVAKRMASGRRLLGSLVETLFCAEEELNNEVPFLTGSRMMKRFIRKNRQEDIPQDFNVVIEDIAGFLKPIVDSLVVGHSFKGTWTAPGPWFLL